MKIPKKTIFFLLPVLIVVEVFLVGININSKKSLQASEVSASNDAQLEVPVKTVVQKIETPKPPEKKFDIDPNANPQAAFAMEMDGDHKVLVDQSSNKQLPIASLTKLMTALVIMDSYDLNQKVTVSPTAMAVQGEQGQLKLGEQLSVKNLLYIMLMESSNRAAQALSEVVGHNVFLDRMNKRAIDLGLSQTHFGGATGLSSSTYSSASDIAKLAAYLYENYPLFRDIVSQKQFDLYTDDGHLHHTLISTNKLLGEDGIVGGKTGWTDEAQGCMMVIQDINGKRAVYVVLGATDRFLEMRKLLEQHVADTIQ